MVDVADSKSADGDIVWVRVPPPAPEKGHPKGCPFSGGQPAAGNDPLRSNRPEGIPNSLRHRPMRNETGSDLDCPGAPKQRPQTGALFWYSPVKTRTGGSIRETPKIQAQRGIFGKSNGCRERSEPQSGHRHHVRRTQLRSVSAVCVRAAKTAHPLRPTSFPKRESHGGLPFRL